MSDELTREQIEELRASLLELRTELERLLEVTRDGARPVDLNEPIGRLTRIDAIQQQKMAEASRRSLEGRMRQIEAALSAWERGTYGECRECGEPIGIARLSARPEAPRCLDCQEARENSL